MKNLRKKYCDLRDKRNWDVAKYNDKLKEQEEKYKREIDALYTSLADKDDTIGKLQSKIDILYEYYDMDEEPSQEIKTKIRINERIHDLELENIELRNNVRMHDEVRKQALEYACGQARLNLSANQNAFLSRPMTLVTDAFGQSYWSY